MTYPTVFANLAAGNEPLSLFDTMFAIAGQQGNIPCTSSGTNTLTLTPNTNYYVPAAYTNAQIASFKAVATSTGAMTAQIGGLSLLKLFTAAGVQANSGDVVINTHYEIQYWSDLDSGSGGFIILNATVTAIANPVQGTFKNLKITNGASPNTQVAVTCDAVVVQNASGGTARLTTVSLTISTATTGANGLEFRHGGQFHMVCRLCDLQFYLRDHGGPAFHQRNIAGAAKRLYLCRPRRMGHYQWFRQSGAGGSIWPQGAVCRNHDDGGGFSAHHCFSHGRHLFDNGTDMGDGERVRLCASNRERDNRPAGICLRHRQRADDCCPQSFLSGTEQQ